MHFITKMGRKAKSVASGGNKKEEAEKVAPVNNEKETTANDKKQVGSKPNEKNEQKNKKENVKPAETTLNGQLNGNLQKKKK